MTLRLNVERGGAISARAVPSARATARLGREARTSPSAHEPEDQVAAPDGLSQPEGGPLADDDLAVHRLVGARLRLREGRERLRPPVQEHDAGRHARTGEVRPIIVVLVVPERGGEHRVARNRSAKNGGMRSLKVDTGGSAPGGRDCGR